MNRAQRRQNTAQTRKTDPQTLKIQAAQHFQAGLLRESEQLCEQILKNLPRDGDTLHLLGALRLRQQRAQEAVALLEQALQHNAHRISCTRNLVHAYTRTGQITAAMAQAEILVDMPAPPEDQRAHQLLLAGLLLDDGQAGRALSCLADLHRAQPTADVTALYARAHLAMGQGDEAEALLTDALRATPGHVGMVRTLAQYQAAQGRWTDACAMLRRACAAAPQVAELWGMLATLHESAGELPEAMGVLETACQQLPTAAVLCHALATLRAQQGDYDGAIVMHRRAVRAEPLNIAFWNSYAGTLLKLGTFDQDPQALEMDLLTLFALPTANHNAALQVAVRMLQQNPVFLALSHAAVDETAAGLSLARALDDPAVARFLASPLLLQVLQSVFVPFAPFEQVFTGIRRILLQAAAVDGFRGLPVPFETVFVAALAHQCFLNEYVFWVSPDEQAQVAELEAALGRTPRPDPRLLALYGCYRPLRQLPRARHLLQHPAATQDTALAFLLRRQITEPLMEQRLSAGMVQLTPIENTVSNAVRGMYEENPYPRWDNFIAAQPQDFATYWRQRCGWLDPRDIAPVAAPRLLIAGCGTGKHAFQSASMFRHADVLAVDLSRASLAFASRKQQELNLRNVRFAQADILQLDQCADRFPDTFDQIESAGVLHHLADPMAGWRVLVGLLKPGGFMKIALYSAMARRNIVAARAMVTAGGYDATPDGIRRWRQDLIRMPVPAADAISPRHVMRFSDFFSLSMCRDLVFHVQEHAFTLPQIGEMSTALGLEFLGFEFVPNEPAPRRYAERFPDDPHQISLANWHLFETENPDTFRAMYQMAFRKISA